MLRSSWPWTKTGSCEAISTYCGLSCMCCNLLVTLRFFVASSKFDRSAKGRLVPARMLDSAAMARENGCAFGRGYDVGSLVRVLAHGCSVVQVQVDPEVGEVGVANRSERKLSVDLPTSSKHMPTNETRTSSKPHHLIDTFIHESNRSIFGL